MNYKDKYKVGDRIIISVKDGDPSLDHYAPTQEVDIVAYTETYNAFVLGWKEKINNFGWSLHEYEKFSICIPNIQDYKYGYYLFEDDMLVHGKVNYNIVDGQFCISCTNFSPMAQSNLPDNKFKCWSCRS